MGQINRDPLLGFLSEHVPDASLLDRLMGLLELFFMLVKSGTYPLVPEAKLDTEQVRKAIALAVGEEVARIVFISLEHPSPEPPRMTEEVYRKYLKNDLEGCLRDSLGTNLGITLRDSLGTSLWGSLWITLRDSLGSGLWSSQWVGLFHLLGFAIAGKAEMVEQLTPLVELLPRAIPLGVKRGEPGVWVVLTA